MSYVENVFKMQLLRICHVSKINYLPSVQKKINSCFHNVAFSLFNLIFQFFHLTRELKRYGIHCILFLNIEVCSRITSVKYAFKYIYKRHDKQVINIDPNGQYVVINKMISGCTICLASRDNMKDF